MRSANFVEETTASIAGTLGDGAVTLTAIANTPRFSTAFGTIARTVRYVIEDTVNKKFEQGIGSVSSNVLTRTRPQVTWDGTTWLDSAPAPLAFGSTPTSGNILIRMSATAEGQSPNIHARQATVAGDSWRDYPISSHILWSTITGLSTSGANTVLTADREYYQYFKLDTPGSLNGFQFEITTAIAGNIKLCLYDIGSDGLPKSKIVDFVTISTAATGIFSDTAVASWTPAGAVWLTPGWYVIGFIASAAVGIRMGGQSIALCPTPVGRRNGYGYSDTLWVAGSYASGMPATPALGSATMIDPGASNGGRAWMGLKVVA